MVNIRQLQVFKTLCDELNFTKTAEKLNMTQPAVSHVIGSLEEEFGVRLVDRLNRRIYLTTAGKLFLAKAIRRWIYMMICGSISGRRKSSSRCEWALV